MNNPFFGNNNQQQNNMLSMYQQFRANPVQFLLNHQIDVPQNMPNDANALTNYLLQTGRLSQAQLNNAFQAAQQLNTYKR